MSQLPDTQQAILFLAANPDGLRRVGQELREIKEGLKRSKQRDCFSLTPCLDVRPRDIQRALLDDPPNIIHFAGRGMGQEGLVLEDETGQPKVVDTAALAGLFALFVDQIQCVVLNGCYSEVQAQAIAQHVEFVIGIRDEISNETALEFAIGFYDALGAGRPIEFAHKLGCSAIQMQGLPEHLAPVLVQKSKLGQVPECGESAERAGRLWKVPELPPNFLPRLELQSLKSQVLSAIQQPVVVTGAAQRIGVQGMGGIGKSVLAAALAREPEVQAAFPDGIFWITVGIEPLLVTQQADLAEALSGEKPTFNEVKQGKECLGQLLANRTCLLILDDVWQLDHADAFNALGSRSRLLLTTRDGELMTGLGAVPYRLDVLSDEQSLHLLATWAGVEVTELPEIAMVVAQECGNLPLALSLCGAMVRDLTPWEDLLEALREADLEFIQKQFAHYPYPDVFKSLQVSLESLSRTNPIAAERYRELAMFPTDESLPEATILQFWQYTGELKPRVARQLLTTLANKGLLRLDGEVPNRQVSLHDLQQDYLRAQQTDLQPLHAHLLEAYQQDCLEGWHTGPNDGHFFEHLAYHLFEAGQQTQLQALLYDFRWIEAKLTATDINALLADYEWAPDDTELRLIQGALRLSTHVLSQDMRQLPSQVYGRLLGQSTPRVQALLHQITQFQTSPWLRCLVPSLETVGGPLLRTLTGHTAWVNGVAVTPNGRYILSASWDNTVKVWELSTGKEVRTLTGHTNSVMDVAVTSDGRYILSASSDNTVKVWELSTGKEVHSLTGHTDSVKGVAVTPDGRYILSASKDNTVKVWELSTGKEVHSLTGHTGSVMDVAVTPDGRYILSASWDNTVKVWELSTGKEVRTLTGHTGSVWGVAVTPDGRYILSASLDKTVKVWELSTGKEVRTLTGHTNSVWGVAVTPDGRYILSASEDNTVKVWELSTGKEVHSLTGHTDSVMDVAVTPDGRYILSASWDNTVKVWELSTGKEVYSLTGHTNSVMDVAVTSDGRYILSASWDKTVKVWELSTGKEVRTLTGHTGSVKGVAVTPDGRYILSASSDNTVKVWELSTGKEVRTLTGHTGSVWGVAVTPDGRYILSASSDNTVKVWELSTGKEVRTLTGHTNSVKGVAVTPNGRYILSASSDNTVKVWELSTGKEVRTLTGHTNSVMDVAVTSDGRYILSASSDNTVKVWELSTGKEVRTLTGHTDSVMDVAVTSDGRYILSASEDNTVKVWELSTGKEVYSLTGHTNSVMDVAVTSDGCYILSASLDKTVKVWELSTGREVASFTGNGALTCCAIAPDGLTFMVGERGGQIHFLKLEGVDTGRVK
ncbi:beta-propeller domain-containing protein [Leptolyngbya sp. GGD]|uniref:beta-propeller domain-containing protein n=1 Tax=Leptolyngbya sp. GGD TaxID=2997907 RepID=UPI00227C6BF4|nr:NB-ARC domain-containing protein [Leptolyngbya sp. GGD]MCY6494585.1 NB-ARC domain-containing protein [Leptolyngbya sp. GGD]